MSARSQEVARGPELQAKFPEKLSFLFEKWRYKVAHGGRGSAKSWSYARALLIQGMDVPLRILCAREIQKSIKESVHTLLSSQIDLMGLGGFYEVLENEIRGVNGTVFFFTGLNVQTVTSIKSYEAIDICWVEEGQTVRRRSWQILIPTIREDDSEIWVSFNPELDTDDTYVRFVEDPPEDSFVAEVNFNDNPWFPDVLERTRAEDKRKLPADEYDNIWLGKCRSAIEGAIYANEMREAVEKRRITLVPYEPRLKVHVVCDLGWNDAMFILLVQRDASALRIITSMSDNFRTLDWYSAELRKMNLNWGELWLPDVDGDTGNIQSGGLSARDIFKSLGWNARLVPKLKNVETGIRLARMTFPRVYFNKPECADIISAMRRYRRVVHQKTDEPMRPAHDEASHGADTFRYMCAAAHLMKNDNIVVPRMKGFRPSDPGMGY